VVVVVGVVVMDTPPDGIIYLMGSISVMLVLIICIEGESKIATFPGQIVSPWKPLFSSIRSFPNKHIPMLSIYDPYTAGNFQEK
jgi:hypothetical protein